MPKLSDAIKPPDMEKLVPVSQPAGVSAPPTPDPSSMPGYESLSLAPAPTILSLDVDRQRQFYRRGVSQYRISPLPTKSNPSLNASTRTITTQVVTQAIAAIPPVVPSAPVTDGLVHGDDIWEIDPAYFLVRDDFTMVSVPGGLSDFTSEVAWHGVQGGTAPFLSFVEPGCGNTGGMPSFGFVNLLGNATSNAANFLIPRLAPSSLPQFGWPILDYPKWKLIWVFTISRQQVGALAPAFSWTKVSHYTGLGNWPLLGAELTNTSTLRPLDFIGLRYDTDTTAPSIGDTTFQFETVFQAPTAGAPARNNAQGTVFNTGILATEGRSYRLEISCTIEGSINFFLTDGVTTSSNTMTISKLSIGPSPSVRIDNGIALYTSPGSVAYPWNTGSKVTISGGSISQFNNTFTLMSGALQPQNGAWLMSGTQAPATDTGATTTLWPALLPFVAFGNDSQAGPVNGSKGIEIDFFGFVWNPGVGGGTGTPNSTLARYW